MNPLMSMIGNMGGGNNPMGAMMQAMQTGGQSAGRSRTDGAD